MAPPPSAPTPLPPMPAGPCEYVTRVPTAGPAAPVAAAEAASGSGGGGWLPVAAVVVLLGGKEPSTRVTSDAGAMLRVGTDAAACTAARSATAPVATCCCWPASALRTAPAAPLASVGRLIAVPGVSGVGGGVFGSAVLGVAGTAALSLPAAPSCSLQHEQTSKDPTCSTHVPCNAMLTWYHPFSSCWCVLCMGRQKC